MKGQDKYPEGTIFIQIRGIYDGWSVAMLSDQTLVNRWDADDRRYKATQEWIEKQREMGDK